MTAHTPERAAHKTVAILAGGRSSEHAISLITACNVMQALDTKKYQVIPLAITPAGHWYLTSLEELQSLTADQTLAHFKGGGQQVYLPMGEADSRLRLVNEDGSLELGPSIDVVFPLLHGPFGEDGSLQGLLEMAGLPYVGCGVACSAMGMDKHFMKLAFEAAGLEVGPYRVITWRQWQQDKEAALTRLEQLGLPVFVKPARAGSSFGITRVDNFQDLEEAIELAHKFDPKVIVEAGISGREIECAVLDSAHSGQPRASYPGEIVVDKDSAAFYDFEAKYVSTSDAYTQCPADLPQDIEAKIRQQAVQAFLALDGEGMCRADFFYTDQGKVIINEINTVPGFTPISMYKVMWEKSGLSFSDLLDQLIQLALARPLGLR